MYKDISALLLTAAVFITAAAGGILKYFEVDTYIIILGFRFHTGCMLPFLIIAPKLRSDKIKKYYAFPEYKKQFIPLLWIVIPLLMIILLFISGFIELTDPEYFYELGVSSIIDYPLYLIWNFLQLSALFIFLKTIQESFKNKVLVLFIAVVLLFFYEFLPFEATALNYNEIFLLAATALSAALIVRYYPNIYWFAIIFFTHIWTAVLLFGSESDTLIGNVLAAKFDYWEGFLTAGKTYNEYLDPAYTGIFFIAVLFSSMIARLTNKVQTD